MAGKVASALHAEKLILLTNTTGVQKDGQLVTRLASRDIEPLIKDGVIRDGMRPKTMCAWDALASGVKTVHIIDGRIQHAVLLELFTSEGIGTLLYS